MGTLDQIRLVAIDEVPSPVENSLYQAFALEHGSLVLAYHLQQRDGVIGVLNYATRWPCASLRFEKCVSARVDFWDGEVPSSHPFGAHGLMKNSLYQVEGSQWLLETRSGAALDGIANLPLKHFVFAFRARVIQILASSFSLAIGKHSLEECLAST